MAVAPTRTGNQCVRRRLASLFKERARTSNALMTAANTMTSSAYALVRERAHARPAMCAPMPDAMEAVQPIAPIVLACCATGAASAKCAGWRPGKREDMAEVFD